LNSIFIDAMLLAACATNKFVVDSRLWQIVATAVVVQPPKKIPGVVNENRAICIIRIRADLRFNELHTTCQEIKMSTKYGMVNEIRLHLSALALCLQGMGMGMVWYGIGWVRIGVHA